MPSQTPTYPKRLIEVDLPIKKISEHARREKSIRHGHISTLHIWWARRPLAACRAVICASLWPDPADPLCPEEFIKTARDVMDRFWNQQKVEKRNLKNTLQLRQALLDFIADFSNWDNSTKEAYLSPARELTQIAHEALGGESGTRPLVVDPFAGGGSIPLEALRVGADVHASDLNPIPVLLNKMVLEYIPKYGKDLVNEIRKWGRWVKDEAQRELFMFYPDDPDGSTPIAYLWARTIKCEGPGCGAEVPLIRSLWVAKKKNRSVALKIIPNQKEKKIDFDILQNATVSEVMEGTVKRGSLTCPICGYTTPVTSVRAQIKANQGGARNSLLYCVVTSSSIDQKTNYRLPNNRDKEILHKAELELESRIKDWKNELSLIPNENSNEGKLFNNSAALYGMVNWGLFFPPRQALMLSTYNHLIDIIPITGNSQHFSDVIRTLLALTVSKQASFSSSLCVWRNVRSCVAQTFGRQALPIVWDYGEMNPFIGSAGDFSEGIEYVIKLIEHISNSITIQGSVEQANATISSKPSESVDLFFTDPPYYYSVQYSGLSDFFYVWLRRSLNRTYPDLFINPLTPKIDEIVVSSPTQAKSSKGKNNEFYESRMTCSLLEGRRITKYNGIATIVFAQMQTRAWETFLQSIIDSGWTITASWPIDTERPGRILSQRQIALASSIHLVCRPRENPDGSLRINIGDWREVLQELPIRIHEWMPKLASEGVVGADAIFACLGPALEIFSRYSSVEKPNGNIVALREYLEHVWAAVAKEALSMIFTEADTSEFEEDARLTAMWLWTLSAGDVIESTNNDENEEEEEEVGESVTNKKIKGYVIEYDAARKIAQGLGADLSALPNLVEITKKKARLLPVSERSQYLLGKVGAVVQTKDRKKKDKQVTLGGTSEDGTDIPHEVVEIGEVTPGKTTLDRIHQSMILFQAGRGEALKSFLLEHGRDQKFWKLAQSLSALYPPGTDEKRWVDGVLARKKGLGL